MFRYIVQRCFVSYGQKIICVICWQVCGMNTVLPITSFISVCHWAKISLFSRIRLLFTQIFQRIAYHKWIKENRLPHAVVRKGQTERFLSYGESYKLYGAFRFLQYILQCYNFACSNRYIMQRLYLFLRLICAYLIAVVLIPVAWICKLFRR